MQIGIYEPLPIASQIRSTYGLFSNKFIRIVRLNKAKELLKIQQYLSL